VPEKADGKVRVPTNPREATAPRPAQGQDLGGTEVGPDRALLGRSFYAPSVTYEGLLAGRGRKLRAGSMLVPSLFVTRPRMGGA